MQKCSTYHNVSPNLDRTIGGLSMMVNNRTPCTHIHLNTPLQILLWGDLEQNGDVFYNSHPSHINLQNNDIEGLLGQLPSSFILLRDFSFHNQ